MVVLPFTVRLFPMKALLVTVLVPTTWSVFTGIVTQRPRVPS